MTSKIFPIIGGRLLGMALLLGLASGALFVSASSASAFTPISPVLLSAVIVRVADESPQIHEAYWGETDEPLIIEMKALYGNANFLTSVGLKLNEAVVAKAGLFDDKDNLLQSVDTTGNKTIQFNLLDGSNSDLPRIPSNDWRKFHIRFTYIDNSDGGYEDGLHLQSCLWPGGFKGWYINPKNDKWLPLKFIFDTSGGPIFEAVLTKNIPQYTPEFSVITLDVPPAQNVAAGITDFDWMYASITNETAEESIRVTTLKIEDTLGDAGDSFGALTNAEIWADLDSNGSYETKVSNTEQFSDTGAPIETYLFTLTNPIVVESSIKIALRADLSINAPAGDTHTIRVSEITAEGSDTSLGATGTYDGTGQTMTVVVSGSLTSSVDGSSPVSSIVIGGTSNYTTLAAFKFSAVGEAQTITKLTFTMDNATLSGSAGYSSMDKMKISFPTKTGTDSRELSVYSARTTFDGLDMYAPKDSSAVVTVSGTAKKIGFGGIFHGTLTVGLDTTGDDTAYFSSVGETSGTTLDGGDVSDQFGSAMILYNTIPTVTAANPSGSGTIQPGSVIDLYKFKVTADAAGEIAIKRFTFTVFVTDASTTSPSSADLSNFTFLRDGMDITGYAQITDITTATPVTLEDTNYIENNISAKVQVAFGDTPAGDTEQVVSAGQTVTYTLRALCGTGFTTTDAISTSMNYDSANQGIDHTYLADTDMDPAVEDVIGLSTTGTHTGDAYNFIWSDRSTLFHNATFSETTSTASSSGDWTNSYLVKNFPLSGYGYTL